MAQERLTDRTSISTIADGDLFHAVDVSDLTDHPSGTSKKTLWSLIKSTLKTYFDTLYIDLPTEGTNGQVLTTDGAGDYTWQTVSGSGTVTSVAISGSDGIEVDSGSPITTSGTIALGLNKANTLTFLNVEDGAEVNTVDSVNGATGAVVLDENDILGTAAYNASITGTVNFDLSSASAFYYILTGNTTATFTNTPSSGESFVRTYIIKSTATETLGFANSDNEFGAYAADGTENFIVVEASNYPTAGLVINVQFLNPN